MALDTSGPDKGLNAIFSHVRMDDDLFPLRRLLTDPRGITRWLTTDDFFHYVNPEAVEAHIERILDNFEDFKEAGPRELPNHRRERAIGKLRQAYNCARRLTAAIDEIPLDADEDLEAPLAPGVMSDLAVKWDSRYHFKIRKEYIPCNENVAQYHRMCKRVQAFKFLALEKHKALEGAKSSSDGVLGIQLHYDRMRIMAYAIAKGGNFQMTCSVLGPNTIMAPLDVNVNYADDALQKALLMRSPQWMLERDKATRILMITKIQDGMSQGEALRQAWKECTFEWKDATLEKDAGKRAPTRNPNARDRSPLKRRKKRRSPSASSTRSPPPSAKKKERNKKKQEKEAKGKKEKSKKKKKDDAKAQKNQKYVNMGTDNKKCCVFWNKSGGCNKGKDCPDLHNYCNRRLKGGGGCGENHPAYKCDNPDRVK